jgi:putative ABC transport system permease protein
VDEVRFAWRRLRHRSAATVASILTLACAIGAAAATWSLLAAVLIEPLAMPRASRIVVVESRAASARFATVRRDAILYPAFLDIRDSGVLEETAAEWMPPESLLTNAGSGTSFASVGFATFNYFDLLGIRIRAGRGFAAGDDRRGAQPVAILTDDYWDREFRRDPAVLGQMLTVAGRMVLIVGVAEPRFRGISLLRSADFYLPFHTIAGVASPITNYFADAGHVASPTSGTKVIGRLRPGSTAGDVAARLASLDALSKLDIELTPVQTAAVPFALRAGTRQFARLLGATVALLLLIGCATVAVLLLVRTEARRDELALCVALGASPRRLAAGIACEGALLTVAGACASLPIAWWLFSAAHTFQLPGGIAIERLNLHLDVRAVGAAAAAATVVALVVSILAATFGVAANAADSLRSRAGATPRIARRRTRSALVVAQVAVALVLVAGATLFARSLAAALSLNTRLDMSRLLTTTVSLGPYGYDATRASTFFVDLDRALAGDAAIASAAFKVDQGGMGGQLIVDGQPREFASMVRFVGVDGRYFRTLGLGVRAGRDFTAHDGPGSPLVAVVSASFARALSVDGTALGRRLTMPYFRPLRPPDVIEVVGVVDDLISDVSVLEPLTMYLPMRQGEATTYRSIMVTPAGSVESAQREVAAAVKSVDAAVARPVLVSLADGIARQMAAQRFGAVVLGALGAIAVVLTILGAYVMAESMAVLRMREMGIRAALGASRRQLAAIVLAETGRLVGFGLAVGFALAWAGAGTIRAFLFQIRPMDPSTLIGVSAAILALAVLISVRPAMKAARVDLAQVLKEP